MTTSEGQSNQWWVACPSGLSRFHAQQKPRFWAPEAYSLEKKFKPCPVTPIFREIKPFDEHVEGLSRYSDRSWAAKGEVQTPIAGPFKSGQFGLAVGKI